MSRSGWFDGPTPRIIAHRGLALTAPENSLAAFAAAVAAGATHLETDVRSTADGAAVLVHDPDAPDGRPVASLDLAALRTALPGVCTVGEALAAFPDTPFNVDVKHADAARPFAEAVRAAGAAPRVLVASFSSRRRAAALRRLPGAATSASAAGVALVLAGCRLRSRALTGLGTRGVQAVQVPERAAGQHLATPWFTSAVHAAGAEVHYWTVNDAARMRRLVALGADGVVTDRADLAADALR